MANPVSVLFEMCVEKQWAQPVFTLKSRTGESHNPVFVFEIKIGNWTAEGTGTSKQKAKHAAAKALLDILPVELMSAMPSSSVPITENNLEPISSNTAIVPLDVKQIKKNVVAQDINAVGQLQELCTIRKWLPPIYTDVSIEGPPHMRTFVVSCKVGNLCHNGVGKTKKHAKHAAAQKMLEHMDGLHGLNTKIINECFDNPLEDTKLMIQDKLSQMMVDGPSGCKEDSIKTIPVDSEIDIDPSTAIEKVDGFILKHNLKIEYFQIQKRSFNQLYQCMAKVNTEPIAVCFGTGTTEIGAKQAAACDIIAYLYIMTDIELI